MTLTIHFSTPPIPNTEAHKRHLIEQYFKQKGIATEPVNITRKGSVEVNHIWIEIKSVSNAT